MLSTAARRVEAPGLWAQEGTQALGGLDRVWGRGTATQSPVLALTGRLRRAGRKEEAGPLLLAQDEGLKTPVRTKSTLTESSHNNEPDSQTIFPLS